MNREDIIRMAEESGLHIFGLGLDRKKFYFFVEQFFDMAQAAEREAISDEWWMCVQSDLENGVKSLNEVATEKWQKEYPEISKFGAWLEARGQA